MQNKERLQIGILFNFSSSWMGGVVYVINLVKTLNYLDDEEKPEIYLFYSPELKKFLNEMKYPYIHMIEWTFPSLMKGYIMSALRRKNVFYDELIRKYNLDVVYPAKNFPIKNKTKAKVVAWYADLQQKYYPEFFSRLTLLHRSIRLHFMLKNASDLIVSSQSVKDDFSKFFKLRKDLKIHIFHFHSINDDYPPLNLDDLKAKYNLPEKYFMISNQFHRHKNHRILLLALADLKKQGIKKHFVITGKFPKDTESPYLAELNKIISENDLHDQISMVGIIPRADQIEIMKHCQAVIQPSLFEGWSTVIEDAISLQVPVIASNIPVNVEQLAETGTYFDPLKTEELVATLSKYPDRDMNFKPYGNYSERMKEAAGVLMNLLKKDNL